MKGKINMIEIEKNSINEWTQRNSGELFISEQLFHKHADLYLGNYNQTKLDIEKALNKTLNNIEFKTKSDSKKKLTYKRVGAKSLNAAIKNSLNGIPNMKFSVDFREGVFFDSSYKSAGFDFAMFDDEYNITNFRNYCFGERAIAFGQEEWEKEINQRPLWKEVSENIGLPAKENKGIELFSKKSLPTIIGGVQFGNWGLVHYDMLNAIHIEQQTEIDLLIYITATGNLEKYLSEGIVNFKNTQQMLKKFENIIKIPIWLIGLDLK
jgi:hypothetical protein